MPNTSLAIYYRVQRFLLMFVETAVRVPRSKFLRRHFQKHNPYWTQANLERVQTEKRTANRNDRHEVFCTQFPSPVEIYHEKCSDKYPHRPLGTTNRMNQSHWFACLKKYQPIRAPRVRSSPWRLHISEIQVQSNQRFFFLAASRLVISWHRSPLRGSLISGGEKSRKTSETRVTYSWPSCCFFLVSCYVKFSIKKISCCRMVRPNKLAKVAHVEAILALFSLTFLPHVDFFWDQLLSRRTVTWNVLINGVIYASVLQLAISISQSKCVNNSTHVNLDYKYGLFSNRRMLLTWFSWKLAVSKRNWFCIFYATCWL